MPALVAGIQCALPLRCAGSSRHPHLLRQILPIGIDRLNGAYLPGARPALDGVLPANGIRDQLEFFEIDEAMDFVAARERRGRPLLVLINARAEIARHADVERAVLAARQNVDVSELGYRKLIAADR